MKLQAEEQLADVLEAVRSGGPNILLIDVRSREDYDEGHIRGAISMPLEEIDRRYKELSEDKEVVTYCYNQHCHLSTLAALRLVEHGVPAREMNVGWKEWVAAGYPIHSAMPEATGDCRGSCRIWTGSGI